MKNCQDPFLLKSEILKSKKNLLENGIREDLIKYLSKFNSFLIIIKSEANKSFGFFIPSQLEINKWQVTKNQICFYWINNESELVTCESKNQKIRSNEKNLI